MSRELLILLAVGVAGAAVYLMWRYMQSQKSASAEDYVAQAKARAQSELKNYLGRDD